MNGNLNEVTGEVSFLDSVATLLLIQIHFIIAFSAGCYLILFLFLLIYMQPEIVT